MECPHEALGPDARSAPCGLASFAGRGSQPRSSPPGSLPSRALCLSVRGGGFAGLQVDQATGHLPCGRGGHRKRLEKAGRSVTMAPWKATPA